MQRRKLSARVIKIDRVSHQSKAAVLLRCPVALDFDASLFGVEFFGPLCGGLFGRQGAICLPEGNHHAEDQGYEHDGCRGSLDAIPAQPLAGAVDGARWSSQNRLKRQEAMEVLRQRDWRCITPLRFLGHGVHHDPVKVPAQAARPCDVASGDHPRRLAMRTVQRRGPRAGLRWFDLAQDALDLEVALAPQLFA